MPASASALRISSIGGGSRASDRRAQRLPGVRHRPYGHSRGSETVIGDHNHLLAYTHVAHDCVLGNHIIASNNTTLAGHVVIEDHVVFGGMTGVHQFCRVGTYCMTGGMSKITQDVPPFLMVDGNPSAVRAYNKVGLERAGLNEERMNRVKFAFRALYREGLNRAQALEKIAGHPEASSDELAAYLAFARLSTRGFVPGHRD